MKVLIVDDNDLHCQAAVQTLSEHDLTIVSSYDEAYVLIQKTGRMHAPSAETRTTSFDAVFCDLLMPAGSIAQGIEGQPLVGQIMPVGWALAINAALRGVRYVAVISDMSHHDHPGSALLDQMKFQIFELHGARALFTNYLNKLYHPVVDSEIDCGLCGGSGKSTRTGNGLCRRCSGVGSHIQNGKNWGRILEVLMSEDTDIYDSKVLEKY